MRGDDNSRVERCSCVGGVLIRHLIQQRDDVKGKICDVMTDLQTKGVVVCVVY